ncbi:MAG: thermonuclease family protein [Candidatus Omnitrophota bacterium]|jgi:micrococcal nuclease
MPEFTVNEIVDGDTFKVAGGWEWQGMTGESVRPRGYDTPEKGEPGFEEAKQKLSDLILNKKVDAKDIKAVDVYGRLIADIYCEDKNLADYFPEYKS